MRLIRFILLTRADIKFTRRIPTPNPLHLCSPTETIFHARTRTPGRELDCRALDLRPDDGEQISFMPACV